MCLGFEEFCDVFPNYIKFQVYFIANTELMEVGVLVGKWYDTNRKCFVF